MGLGSVTIVQRTLEVFEKKSKSPGLAGTCWGCAGELCLFCEGGTCIPVALLPPKEGCAAACALVHVPSHTAGSKWLFVCVSSNPICSKEHCCRQLMYFWMGIWLMLSSSFRLSACLGLAHMGLCSVPLLKAPLRFWHGTYTVLDLLRDVGDVLGSAVCPVREARALQKPLVPPNEGCAAAFSLARLPRHTAWVQVTV
jgi:hypothetical protein